MASGTNSQTLFEAKPIVEINNLAHVARFFHGLHGKKTLEGIKKYCGQVKNIELTSITDKTEFINGCHTLKVSKANSDLTIKNKKLNLPLFSVLNLSGTNLTIESDIVDLGVVNTSQLNQPESVKSIKSNANDPIVFPLVLGFEVNEAFLDFKKGRTYYFSLNHVQTGAQNGAVHSETYSSEGLPAGNLILKVSDLDKSFLPTFIAEGGAAAEPLPGLRGSKPVSFEVDLFSVEEWLASSEGENTVLESYPLDLMSAKNLKNLLAKMKRTNDNKIIIKVDSSYLENIGPAAKKAFEESAKAVGGIKSLDDLATTALASLQADIDDRIANGAELSKVPMLNPVFKMSAGVDGPEQLAGKTGRKGKIIYE